MAGYSVYGQHDKLKHLPKLENWFAAVHHAETGPRFREFLQRTGRQG